MVDFLAFASLHESLPAVKIKCAASFRLLRLSWPAVQKIEPPPPRKGYGCQWLGPCAKQETVPHPPLLSLEGREGTLSEEAVEKWIRLVLGPRALGLLREGVKDSDDSDKKGSNLAEHLKDGRLLVRLAHTLGGARTSGMAQVCVVRVCQESTCCFGDSSRCWSWWQGGNWD